MPEQMEVVFWHATTLSPRTRRRGLPLFKRVFAASLGAGPRRGCRRAISCPATGADRTIKAQE